MNTDAIENILTRIQHRKGLAHFKKLTSRNPFYVEFEYGANKEGY